MNRDTDRPYTELLSFVMDYIRRKSGLMFLFWSLCFIFLVTAIKLRVNVAALFSLHQIFLHSLLGGLIFPLLCVPIHETLHIIPYFLSGGRDIRVGMDLKQYLFYVTAHRHVATSGQFRIVAVIPFFVISLVSIILIFQLPGLWKWSISFFLFVHATMCAGDFAMLNFYFLNRHKKIYTWDDADNKTAYFYEEIR
jgi:hypothetical protein